MTPYDAIDTLKYVNDTAYSAVVQLFATSQKSLNEFTKIAKTQPYRALVEVAKIEDILTEVELHSLEERLS